MNSFGGGGDEPPFAELPRRQQATIILSLCVLLPVGLAAAVVFVSAPVYGVGLAVSGQPLVGLGVMAAGIATWGLSWLLLGL